MLAHSNVKILLAASAAQVKVKKESIELIDISHPLSSSTSILASDCQVDSASMAYVIYTSGTTARPKGVIIEHNNVVRLMVNDKFQFDFSQSDVCTMFHSFCFDFSVWEMYGALLYGGTLVIIPEIMAKDTGKFLKLLKKEKITVLNQTPSAFYNLIDLELDSFDNPGLKIRYVIFGGEALKPSKLKEWKERYPGTRFVNMYGITETTVHVTYKEIESEDIARSISNIGKPIPTLNTYVMDRYLMLTPAGVPGECCVGGDGVGRGYLNKPELTKEKFIQNPYKPGEIIYRSGDLVRLTNSGEMEYMGRIDHQVKIRGFRIEPGEIESQLEAHDEIQEAVVLARVDKNGEKYLCAYIVASNEYNKCSVSQLREYLSQKLPGYMIPSYFVKLGKIPLTSSGKKDRRALPEPDVPVGLDAYIAPRDEIEEKLVGIWSEVLGIEKEKISIDDNFFHLGGHSLKTAIAAARIYKELKVKLPLKEVFKTPFIRHLSGYIKGEKRYEYVSIEPVEKKEYYVLTAAQRRLYILQQMELESTGYNMPYVLPLKEAVNLEKLEKATRKLISRHESLRTSFQMVNEEPFQEIHEKMEPAIEHYDIREKHENIKREVAEIKRGWVKPFNLSQVPLLRIGLIRTGESKHLLLFDMHHIITDGTSQNILMEELMALYSGRELPPLPLHYKDYAQWQNRWNQQESIQRQESYWTNLFSDELPILNLPTDYPRPILQSFEGSRINFALNEKETGHIKNVARENDLTLYMTILAIFNLLLSKLGGEEDIIVGTPIAARQHPDTEKIIGMFVNTLAMRNYPRGDKTFKGFLKEVKDNTLKAYENQGYPFDHLVEKVSVNRDTSRNPVFDVMLNLLNQAGYPGGISLVDEDHEVYDENVTAKFDLNLAALELGERLQFDLEYCTRLFKKETIERFTRYFRQVVVSVIDNQDQLLWELEIISDEEKAEILGISQGIRELYHDDCTIHKRCEEVVEKEPEKTALILGEHRLSYEELNKRSNQVARELRGKGVTRDTVVGLMVERSIEMVTGIIAILKAGGAYLPIDIDYPEERKRYMIENSNVKILLINCDMEGLPHYLPKDTRVIDTRDERIYSGASGNLRNINKGSDLVYVIYTSGSTGKPKGVMLEHGNLLNLVYYQHRYTQIDFSRVLQFTTISFDVSFQEIFSTLLAGGELYLITKESRDNIPELFAIVKENEIRTLFLAAGFLKFVFTTGEYINIFPKGITHLVTAGEQIVVNDRFKEYLKENRVFLHNHYGPSETHVVTSLTLDPLEEIPTLPSIGRPILNTNIYILEPIAKIII